MTKERTKWADALRLVTELDGCATDILQQAVALANETYVPKESNPPAGRRYINFATSEIERVFKLAQGLSGAVGLADLIIRAHIEKESAARNAERWAQNNVYRQGYGQERHISKKEFDRFLETAEAAGWTVMRLRGREEFSSPEEYEAYRRDMLGMLAMDALRSSTPE